MRNYFISLFALALFSLSFVSKTQAQDDPQNIIKINILSPIASTASLFYERGLNETSSLQLGLFYTGASVEDTKIRGFGITPEFRYYLSEKGNMQGFFVAPFLRYQNFQLTDEASNTNNEENKATFNSIGGGLLIGGQWIFKKRISLDLWGGPSYSGGNLKVDGDGTEDDFSTGLFNGFGLRAGVTLGVAF
jgi:hypothetical protein